MNCPVAVEASMFAPNREDTFMPDVGMKVQPFVTCESEANAIFRTHSIVRFSERRQKRLVRLRKNNRQYALNVPNYREPEVGICCNVNAQSRRHADDLWLPPAMKCGARTSQRLMIMMIPMEEHMILIAR